MQREKRAFNVKSCFRCTLCPSTSRDRRAVHGVVISLVVIVLLIAVAACGSTPTKPAQISAGNPVPTVIPTTPPPQSAEVVVWARVPYCNCLADTATANVATALHAADLTVRLQEQSPRNGWLYFAATFDPQTATREQVVTAMKTGGAEVLAAPP